MYKTTIFFCNIIVRVGVSIICGLSVACYAGAPACIDHPFGGLVDQGQSTAQLCVMYGDFDGDQRYEPTVYSSAENSIEQQSTWRFNVGLGFPFEVFGGLEQSVPIIGRWAISDCATQHPVGAHHDMLGVRSSNVWLTSNAMVSNLEEGVTVVPDYSFVAGEVDDLPLVGDWNGDGIDTMAIMRPVADQQNWYFSTDNCGALTYVSAHTYLQSSGPAQPIVGDWNGDDVDDVGLFFPSSRVLERYVVEHEILNNGAEAITLSLFDVAETPAPDGSLAAVVIPANEIDEQDVPISLPDAVGYLQFCTTGVSENAAYIDTVFPVMTVGALCEAENDQDSISQTIIVVIPH